VRGRRGQIHWLWYCLGDYDFTLIADIPNNESMAAIAGHCRRRRRVKSAKTTVLMTGAEASSGYQEGGRGSQGLKASPIVGLAANVLPKTNSL
jgi:hypothetical protein